MQQEPDPRQRSDGRPRSTSGHARSCRSAQQWLRNTTRGSQPAARHEGADRVPTSFETAPTSVASCPRTSAGSASAGWPVQRGNVVSRKPKKLGSTWYCMTNACGQQWAVASANQCQRVDASHVAHHAIASSTLLARIEVRRWACTACAATAWRRRVAKMHYAMVLAAVPFKNIAGWSPALIKATGKRRPAAFPRYGLALAFPHRRRAWVRSKASARTRQREERRR